MSKINQRQNYSETIKYLRKGYNNKIKLSDLSRGLFEYYVYRPMSFAVAVPCIWFGLSANKVTFIRIGFVFILLSLFVTGIYWAAIAAGCLYIFQRILDGVDGNLARVQGTSYFGSYLDEIADVYAKVLTPVTISIGLYVSPDRLLVALSEQFVPVTILVVGLTTALASSLKAYSSSEHDYWELLAEKGRKVKQKKLPRDNLDAVQPSAKTGIKFGAVYRTGVSLMEFLLPVFALFDALFLYLCLIFLSRCLTLPFNLLKSVSRAHRKFDA